MIINTALKEMVKRKSWEKITVRLGCELKTAQQLNALGIKNELHTKNVTIDGIQQIMLVENCYIWAFIDENEEQRVRNLPFVLSIE